MIAKWELQRNENEQETAHHMYSEMLNKTNPHRKSLALINSFSVVKALIRGSAY